ncbi:MULTISPECIES: ATP-dependent nuclease [Rhizobium]|uniref:ATP-dependent nuclease n=1 Tax=Rhizobium TaxID=379 RepID=UPI001C9112AB|nr:MULTISPECIES: AAA family ATPase [Rhizobium]MBY3054407.1 AAA family ATPase [Rhizobium laguerreae]MBY5518301.1 AAA family ATPase [Rhizobium leguminosarum]
MHIAKVIIKNYRTLQTTTVALNKHLNIIVGDNECGKSTLLEAVHLALTGQLNGRPLINELHPYLFNAEAVNSYITSLGTRFPQLPPEIHIEVYFPVDTALANLKGINNTHGEDVPGVSLKILFDNDFAAEFAVYVKELAEVRAMPIEYYKIEWRAFSGNPITARSIPVKPSFIDASIVRNTASASRYVVDMIKNVLTPKQLAGLSLSYRKMKNTFLKDDMVGQVNTELKGLKGKISGKEISVSLDNSARGNWETGIMPHLDDIPITLVGKGEQNSVKIRLAMDAAATSHVFLIEEPENHLSFSNLNILIETVAKAHEDRQIIVTTHSSFVVNKLGVESVILFHRGVTGRLSDLKKDTFEYFMKLPGHDTLRLILAKRAILVEGPSDELVVQKAYLKRHGKMPLSDGVDIITVKSLAFARFLEIAQNLEVRTAVITDNDGKLDALKKKYDPFKGVASISVHYDTDIAYKTLEHQLVKKNGLAKVNKVLGTAYINEDDLIEYMQAQKTDTALAFFDTAEDWDAPDYIDQAIQ